MSTNTLFDTYIMVDWSAKDEPGPQDRKEGKLKKDNIWIGEAKRLGNELSFSQTYCRTRARAYSHLETCLKDHLQAGKRVLVGFDFAFGYPAGFAELLTGKSEWKGVWEYLAENLEDDELNENNRFELAAKVNEKFKSEGPFWGLAKGYDLENLGTKSPWKGVEELSFNEKTIQRLRHTDKATPGTQEVWKLYGAGSVGSQSLTGIPVVWKLRCSKSLEKDSYIWPFETMMLEKEVLEKSAKVVFAEIFPSNANDRAKELGKDRENNRDKPKDQLQVWAMTELLGQADESGELMNWFVEAAALPKVIRSEEAAILQAPAPLEEPKKKQKDKKADKPKRAVKEKKAKSDPITRSREIEKLKAEKQKKREEARKEREKKKEELKKKKEAEVSKLKAAREKEKQKAIEERQKAIERKKKERQERLEKQKAEQEVEKAKKEKERAEKKAANKAKREAEKQAKLAKIDAEKARKGIEEEKERRRNEEKQKALEEAKALAESKAEEEAKIKAAGSLKAQYARTNPELAGDDETADQDGSDTKEAEAAKDSAPTKEATSTENDTPAKETPSDGDAGDTKKG